MPATEFPPLVYVDIIHEAPPDDWPGDTRWQPWRWIAKNANNNEPMARSTEHYTNKQDVLDAIAQLFGSGSNVYLREAEQGNVALRMAAE